MQFAIAENVLSSSSCRAHFLSLYTEECRRYVELIKRTCRAYNSMRRLTFSERQTLLSAVTFILLKFSAKKEDACYSRKKTTARSEEIQQNEHIKIKHIQPEFKHRLTIEQSISSGPAPWHGNYSRITLTESTKKL